MAEECGKDTDEGGTLPRHREPARMDMADSDDAWAIDKVIGANGYAHTVGVAEEGGSENHGWFAFGAHHSSLHDEDAVAKAGSEVEVVKDCDTPGAITDDVARDGERMQLVA